MEPNKSSFPRKRESRGFRADTIGFGQGGLDSRFRGNDGGCTAYQVSMRFPCGLGRPASKGEESQPASGTEGNSSALPPPMTVKIDSHGGKNTPRPRGCATIPGFRAKRHQKWKHFHYGASASRLQPWIPASTRMTAGGDRGPEIVSANSIPIRPAPLQRTRPPPTPRGGRIGRCRGCLVASGIPRPASPTPSP